MTGQQRKTLIKAMAGGVLVLLGLPWVSHAGEISGSTYPVAQAKTDVRKAAQAGLTAAGLPSPVGETP